MLAPVNVALNNAGVMEALGIKRDRIAEALKSRGRTQEWLAEQVGITKQAVGQALARGSLKLEHAIRIAVALDVSLDWLVGLENRRAAIGEVVNGLPDEQKQLALDFLQYQIDRAPERLLASEKAARYSAMIQGIMRDIEKRRGRA